MIASPTQMTVSILFVMLICVVSVYRFVNAYMVLSPIFESDKAILSHTGTSPFENHLSPFNSTAMNNSTTEVPPFDHLKILDHEHREIPLSRKVPPGYDRYLIPGSTIYSAIGTPGVFLFQKIPYPRYSFWISNYFSDDNKKVTSHLQWHSLELHLLLQSDLMFRLNGFDWQSLKESQYNLMFVSEIQNEVLFDKKNYLTFDIHPSFDLLETISHHHSQLIPFLEQVRQGRHVRYFKHNPYASAPMLYLVKQIITSFSGTADVHINLDETVERLIHLALNAPLKGDDVHFNFYDIERIWDAKEQIIRYIDEEDILNQQYKAAAMRRSKFREGFVQIFGELPHNYVHRKRMEKARILLMSGQHFHVRDVARQVGYLNPGNFTVSYKKFFGTSPQKDRDKNR